MSLGRLRGALVVYELDDSRITVGRSPECDISFPESRSVSAAHAVIEVSKSGTGAVLRDLNSRNGTFVNDRRISNGATVVHNGDIIRFGFDKKSFRFELPNSVEAMTGLTAGFEAAPANPPRSHPVAQGEIASRERIQHQPASAAPSAPPAADGAPLPPARSVDDRAGVPSASSSGGRRNVSRVSSSPTAGGQTPQVQVQPSSPHLEYVYRSMETAPAPPHGSGSLGDQLAYQMHLDRLKQEAEAKVRRDMEVEALKDKVRLLERGQHAVSGAGDEDPSPLSQRPENQLPLRSDLPPTKQKTLSFEKVTHQGSVLSPTAVASAAHRMPASHRLGFSSLRSGAARTAGAGSPPSTASNRWPGAIRDSLDAGLPEEEGVESEEGTADDVESLLPAGIVRDPWTGPEPHPPPLPPPRHQCEAEAQTEDHPPSRDASTEARPLVGDAVLQAFEDVFGQTSLDDVVVERRDLLQTKWSEAKSQIEVLEAENNALLRERVHLESELTRLRQLYENIADHEVLARVHLHELEMRKIRKQLNAIEGAAYDGQSFAVETGAGSTAWQLARENSALRQTLEEVDMRQGCVQHAWSKLIRRCEEAEMQLSELQKDLSRTKKTQARANAARSEQLALLGERLSDRVSQGVDDPKLAAAQVLVSEIQYLREDNRAKDAEIERLQAALGAVSRNTDGVDDGLPVHTKHALVRRDGVEEDVERMRDELYHYRNNCSMERMFELNQLIESLQLQLGRCERQLDQWHQQATNPQQQLSDARGPSHHPRGSSRPLWSASAVPEVCLVADDGHS